MGQIVVSQGEDDDASGVQVETLFFFSDISEIIFEG